MGVAGFRVICALSRPRSFSLISRLFATGTLWQLHRRSIMRPAKSRRDTFTERLSDVAYRCVPRLRWRVIAFQSGRESRKTRILSHKRGMQYFLYVKLFSYMHYFQSCILTQILDEIHLAISEWVDFRSANLVISSLLMDCKPLVGHCFFKFNHFCSIRISYTNDIQLRFNF